MDNDIRLKRHVCKACWREYLSGYHARWASHNSCNLREIMRRMLDETDQLRPGMSFTICGRQVTFQDDPDELAPAWLIELVALRGAHAVTDTQIDILFRAGIMVCPCRDDNTEDIDRVLNKFHVTRHTHVKDAPPPYCPMERVAQHELEEG